MQTDDWLPLYLRDHYAGSTAGVRLFIGQSRHAVADLGHAMAVGDPSEVQQDRDSLAEIMAALDVRRDSLTEYAAVAGEFLGRFKPNGSLWHRSPGADVLELEALSTAVAAKATLWETLLSCTAGHAQLDTAALTALHERALAQERTLKDLHERVVAR